MDQDEAIRFLSDPGSYGPNITRVDQRETHGAIVFLAGDRAYKLKRAVRYPYLDYSTPERRRAMCEAELSVNRRTAPELYLGVKSIRRERGGTLRFGDKDERQPAIDWVVEMRRFDESKLLEEMRKRGALTPQIMRDLADEIAKFHRNAEAAIGPGGAKTMVDVIEENLGILRDFEARPFAHEAIGGYEKLVRHAYQHVCDRLDRRGQDGFIRHCHGDLHLNNICLFDAKPVLFDAIEFNDSFSTIDVLYDFSFLLMDLEHRGLRSLANILLNRYLENTEDYDGVSLLPLFLSCRAAVRAHVNATLAWKTEATHRRASLLCEAHSLLRDASSALAGSSPKLVVIGGVSGTGKSTLARAFAAQLSPSPGAIVLRSDAIRKRLLNRAETETLPAEGYAEDITARVYGVIEERARVVLNGGHSVIADAVFGLPAERHQLQQVAISTNVPFLGVWLHAPEYELARRLQARHNDASDATVEVLRHQLRTIAPPRGWTQLDASGPPEACLNELRRALEC